jgi:sterol desaturase/sphingolipid hydroxylase (fatty acid hydroxylase superfamily)
MQLGRIGYYTDFVIYPVLVAASATAILARGDGTQRVHWLAAVAGGLAAWTFLEYIMHRLILHRVAFFERMHLNHHGDPTARLGTPSWLSLAFVGFAIFLPSALALGLLLGSGVTVGIMIGYLWYIVVHHAVHHWRLDHDGYLYRAKRRHAQHHHTQPDRGYGVTTALWDHMLGTALVRSAHRRPDLR